MTKKITAPAKKAATKVAPAVAKPTPVKAPLPAPVTAPTAAKAPAPVPAASVEAKKIDMNKQSIKDAIVKGKALIKEGKSKADAAMAIFEALKAEGKEVVIAAFVQGATLTEKGAVTYWYNCSRKSKKAAAKSA
jgi:hypothetical protein